MSKIMINNTATPIGRTPNLIAAEINSIKEQTRKMVLYNSIEIGRRLVEAKQLLGHGEWGEWLKKSVDYSKSTANNLMRIFNEYGSDQITLLDDNSKSQALGNLSYTQAIALLGIPEEDRENFVKENDIDNMSTRELQKAIKEKQELEEKLKEAEKKAVLDSQALETVNKSYKRLEETNNEHYEQTKKLKEQLASIKSKNKEALTNREVEIENLKIFIEDTKKQLEKAQSSGNDEEVQKLQASLQNKEGELIDLHKKIKELEQQLKDKPIEVTETIVEKIPEEIERELNDLREKVKHQPQDNESIVKFKIHFEKTVESIKGLLTVLVEIKETNEDEYEKYKKAVSGLINKMLDSL